jgi:hypothetical protein
LATQSRSASFIASLSVAAPARHRHHFGAQQLHAEHVGRLARHIGRAHVDDAGQAEARADRGGGDAVLARAGFRDDPGLAHADRQQDLADAVVDLVRAGVVQLVALEPDLGAHTLGCILAQFLGEAGREIERAGPADIVFEQVVEFGGNAGSALAFAVFLLEIEDQRHQRFGDIAAAELAEMAALVGLVAEAVGGRHGHGRSAFRSCAPRRRRRQSCPHP